MRVSEVEVNAAGEVTHYSCPECGGALELCHDRERERERGPHETTARFLCVVCNEEVDKPTHDPKRTAERRYSVRVEIAFDDHHTAGILCEAEELKCFESERQAREYVYGLFYAVFDEAHRDDLTVETQPG
jgi:predicted RNA-binding Zn-ribbon protein involved in translation (DUF1610 family)